MARYFTAQQQVESLRALADFIEANADLPWDGYVGERFGWTLVHADGDAVAAFAAAGGGWEKSATEGERDGNFNLDRTFGDAIRLRIICPRSEVCERKVVGVETVEVPDPDAPTITIEREVVEWECKSILAQASA